LDIQDRQEFDGIVFQSASSFFTSGLNDIAVIPDISCLPADNFNKNLVSKLFNGSKTFILLMHKVQEKYHGNLFTQGKNPFRPQ
jgi:hypothetical protein